MKIIHNFQQNSKLLLDLWTYFGMELKSMSELNSALDRHIKKLRTNKHIKGTNDYLAEETIEEILAARREYIH